MAVVLKILNSTTIRMREGTTASTHDSKAGNLSLCHSPRPQFYIFLGEGATFGGAQGAIVTVAKGSLLAEFMRPYVVLGLNSGSIPHARLYYGYGPSFVLLFNLLFH